jgi:photosystem II stability/assembly factor-like uncharacterized protein
MTRSHRGFRPIPGSRLRPALLAVAAGVAVASLAPPAAPAQTRPSPAPLSAPLKAVWEPISYPEDLALNDVLFVTPEIGWVAGGAEHGGGGVVLHTEDGGKTWAIQTGDPASRDRAFNDLRFSDPKHGWVTRRTTSGTDLLRTRDGTTWEQVGQIAEHYTDYVFVSPGTGFFTDGRTISRSTDGGRTWKPVFTCHIKAQVNGLTQEMLCSPASLSFPTRQVGYAVAVGFNAPGLRQQITLLKTTDGGGTWTPSIANATSEAEKVVFTGEATGFVRLKDGKIYGTTDGGQTWRGLGGSGGRDLRFADPEVGWSFAYRKLSYTVDGGRQWTSRDVALPAAVQAFSLPRRDRGYVVGEHGMIFRYRLVAAGQSAAGALEAPAMPSVSAAIQTQLAQAQTQLQAVSAKVTALPEGPLPPGCCQKPLADLQTGIGAVAATVPVFQGQYRNTNLIIAGLQLVADLSSRLSQVQTAFGAVRHAPDRAGMLAAISQLSLALQGLGGSTTVALQEQPLPADTSDAQGDAASAASAAAVVAVPETATAPAAPADSAAPQKTPDAVKKATNAITKRLKPRL